MPELLTRLARRIARRAPESWKAGARAALVGRSYTLNTRGHTPNDEMLRWFDIHGRPISIVIPSYNDVDLLTAALHSIEQTCGGVDYEVIIVDDYINDAVSAQLRTLASERVRVVFKEERLGFAGTVNVGMALAAHDIVLLNSDIVAKPGWVQALQYSAYALDERIGMVSPMLTYPDGRIQYAGTYYARLLAPQWFGHLHVGSPATRATAGVAGYNRSISGACVYITRAAYDTVGPLDGEFWLGFEDVDYGLRAWERGVRCFYQPAALLVHHESASRGYSQGHRELASMRKFWRRWQDRFLARREAQASEVNFVVGKSSQPLWRAYIEKLAEDLRRNGRTALIHSVDPTGRDDGLIAELQANPGIVIACDWSSAETVWLATVNEGLPVYLLPAMESVLFPHEPARQAAIVAGYRSEFDYIAPNRWTQRQLQAETAWEARARIAPAVPPGSLPAGGAPLIVTIAADAAARECVDAYAATSGMSVRHVDAVSDPTHVDEIRSLTPRAIVDFGESHSSLVPYSLMSVGAVYIARSDPRVSHEVLDGYNALTFPDGDLGAVIRALADVREHDQVWSELRENGHDSAARAARAVAPEFERALGSFSDVPV